MVTAVAGLAGAAAVLGFGLGFFFGGSGGVSATCGGGSGGG
jgi:hypothetical protein